MATRYWVLGSGTWDLTTTTNWSATSGGTGGASAPTSADDVIFDAGSNVGTGAFTVTIGAAGAVCRDISFGGAGGALDGAMTLAGSGAWSVYGSMTLVSTNLTFSYGGIVTFAATTTGKTITTAGKSFTLGNGIIFNGVGGGWTLQDACTFYKITLTAGALDTNNQTVSLSAGSSAFITSGSTTRSLTLGTSTVSMSGIINAWNVTATTGFTLSAASSTLNFTGGSNDMVGGGLTYGTVTMSASTGTIAGANTITTVNYNNSGTGGTLNLSGANSITTLNATSTTGLQTISCGANQTITTLNATSTSATVRTFFVSDIIGTARTLTITTRNFTIADFRDITIAGTVLTGTSFADCGGNSNITFTAAKTVYWNLAGAQNWNATGWATSSGGSPAVANFPLAQDTAVFDNTGSVTGTITVNGNFNIGTVNITKTGAMTLSFGTSYPQIYGSFTLGALTTLTGGNRVYLSGRSTTQTITTNTRTFGSSGTGITIQALSSTITFADTFTTTGALTHNNGTLNLNNLTITAPGFDSSAGSTRAITFGTTGNITANGAGSFFITVNATGLSTTGTPTLNISNNSAVASSFYLQGFTESTAFNVNVTTGTYTLTEASGTSYYKNLNFTGFAGTFTGGASGRVVYGNLTTSTGMSYGSTTGAMTFAATSGTQTITSNAKTMDFPITFNGTGGTFQLVDALTVGITRTTTLTAGTLDLNNFTLTSGLWSSFTGTRVIAFGTTGNITLIGSGSVFQMSGTNFTFTGTSTFNISNNSATAVSGSPSSGFTSTNALNVNYTTGTYALTETVASVYRNLSYSGFSGTVNNVTRTLYGNLTLGSGGTYTAGTSAITFAGAAGTTQTITSTARTMDFPVTFNGTATTTYQLADAMTVGSSRTTTLTTGTLDLNNKTLTTGLFSASSASTRSLLLGSSSLVCTGSGASVFTIATTTGMTLNAGTSTISLTSASAKTFTGGGLTYYNLNQGGAGALTIASSNTFNNITNSVQPTTVTFTASTTQTVSNFGLTGTAGNLVTINSSTAGTRANISKSTGIVDCNYLSIRDSNATGGAGWYAGTTSTDVSNNLGWVFTAPPYIYVTGVSATGQVGTATVSTGININVNLTGVSATGDVGSVTTITDQNVSVTGVSATGNVGTVTISIGRNVDVTGVSATGRVGSVTVTGTASTSVTGVSATGSVGSVTVSIGINVSVTGVSATGSVGSVTLVTGANVSVTGVSATGNVGSVSFVTTANVSVTGVSATGQVGTLFFFQWDTINDSQDANWVAINDSQSPNWTTINPNSPNTWADIVI